MTFVGNDVVDLLDPRCQGKAADRRFVERVFAEDEAAAIRDAPRPDRTLWLYWAAKEAAYKTVTKLMGAPPTFEHRAFRVEEGGADPPEGSERSGRVVYGDEPVPFRGETGPGRIHVLGWHPPEDATTPMRWRVRRLEPGEGQEGPGGWRASLRERFTDDEWRSVHSLSSALVRLRARADLAGTLGVEEGAVEIVCPPGPPGRMPPAARIRGRSWAGDVSLSHHGGLVAWAFTLPGAGGSAP